LGQSSRETSIDSLRRVLELECQKGYCDKAVIGGLDKFLRKQTGRILRDISNRELSAAFNSLDFAKSDYSAWDRKKRREWIAVVFNWIARTEEARKRKRKSAPAPDSPAVTARVREIKKTSSGLDSAITCISGIAPNTATKFAKLGVETVYDLLHFLPRRYIDYSQRKPIAKLEQGKEQTIIAKVWQSSVVTLGRKRGAEGIVGDETGNIRVVWF